MQVVDVNSGRVRLKEFDITAVRVLASSTLGGTGLMINYFNSIIQSA